MADGVSVSAALTVQVSHGTVINKALAAAFTLTGNDWKQGRQSIGTSEEAIALGDVAAGGYWLIINRDATNYVEIRPNTAVADLIRLNAGQFALFPTATDAVPYAIADTAACIVDYWICDP